MTITMDHDGQRVTFCLPDRWDKALSALVPLYKQNGFLFACKDATDEIRGTFEDTLEYGVENADSDLREMYTEHLRRTMGATA